MCFDDFLPVKTLCDAYYNEFNRGTFFERPSKLSGPISMINHPVSPRELFGCLSRLPLFSSILTGNLREVMTFRKVTGKSQILQN